MVSMSPLVKKNKKLEAASGHLGIESTLATITRSFCFIKVCPRVAPSVAGTVR